MERIQPRTRALFASGLIGMGLVGLRFGDFASVLQEFPTWVSARTAIIYIAAALMLLGGIGLLFERTAAISARIIFYYLALWALLLNVPIVLKAPLIEVNYQGLGEIMVILAGGWVLSATLETPAASATSGFAAGKRGVRGAQILFGLALIPLGLAHFFYLANTVKFVPAWLPFRTGWAYFTGAAQVAAGLGVLLSIVPRLAAILDTVLLALFTTLVWIPLLFDTPGSSGLWSEFTVSWAITAGAWVVASSFAPARR
jgi:uncharacterized membrane protein